MWDEEVAEEREEGIPWELMLLVERVVVARGNYQKGKLTRCGHGSCRFVLTCSDSSILAHVYSHFPSPTLFQCRRCNYKVSDIEFHFRKTHFVKNSRDIPVDQVSDFRHTHKQLLIDLLKACFPDVQFPTIFPRKQIPRPVKQKAIEVRAKSPVVQQSGLEGLSSVEQLGLLGRSLQAQGCNTTNISAFFNAAFSNQQFQIPDKSNRQQTNQKTPLPVSFPNIMFGTQLQNQNSIANSPQANQNTPIAVSFPNIMFGTQPQNNVANTNNSPQANVTNATQMLFSVIGQQSSPKQSPNIVKKTVGEYQKRRNQPGQQLKMQPLQEVQILPEPTTQQQLPKPQQQPESTPKQIMNGTLHTEKAPKQKHMDKTIVTEKSKPMNEIVFTENVPKQPHMDRTIMAEKSKQHMNGTAFAEKSPNQHMTRTTLNEKSKQHMNGSVLTEKTSKQQHMERARAVLTEKPPKQPTNRIVLAEKGPKQHMDKTILTEKSKQHINEIAFTEQTPTQQHMNGTNLTGKTKQHMNGSVLTEKTSKQQHMERARAVLTEKPPKQPTNRIVLAEKGPKQHMDKTILTEKSKQHINEIAFTEQTPTQQHMNRTNLTEKTKQHMNATVFIEKAPNQPMTRTPLNEKTKHYTNRPVLTENSPKQTVNGIVSIEKAPKQHMGKTMFPETNKPYTNGMVFTEKTPKQHLNRTPLAEPAPKQQMNSPFLTEKPVQNWRWKNTNKDVPDTVHLALDELAIKTINNAKANCALSKLDVTPTTKHKEKHVFVQQQEKHVFEKQQEKNVFVKQQEKQSKPTSTTVSAGQSKPRKDTPVPARRQRRASSLIASKKLKELAREELRPTPVDEDNDKLDDSLLIVLDSPDKDKDKGSQIPDRVETRIVTVDVPKQPEPPLKPPLEKEHVVLENRNETSESCKAADPIIEEKPVEVVEEKTKEKEVKVVWVGHFKVELPPSLWTHKTVSWEERIEKASELSKSEAVKTFLSDLRPYSSLPLDRDIFLRFSTPSHFQTVSSATINNPAVAEGGWECLKLSAVEDFPWNWKEVVRRSLKSSGGEGMGVEELKEVAVKEAASLFPLLAKDELDALFLLKLAHYRKVKYHQETHTVIYSGKKNAQ